MPNVCQDPLGKGPDTLPAADTLPPAVYRGQAIVVFGGDVLFRGSIGRSDFPGCDGALLVNGIRAKLFTLPPDTVVYPGHGPVTTIGHEKRMNPFVGDG